METSDNVFVTGATGFIGTRLVQALVERGHRVRALSRRDNPAPPPGMGSSAGGPLAHEYVELVRGDVTDRDSLARAIQGCTLVFHLAGYAKNWAPNPQVFYAVNVQGTRNVFDAARQEGVRRVVWTSSQLTFGPPRPGHLTTEDSPRISDRYFTEYQRTKSITEEEAIRAAQQGGFPVVIVNPARVYGPGHLTEGNSVTLLIDQYDRGRAPVLPNLGRNVANWVLVDDVVEGHILAMEKGRIGEQYILGGENASLREFFRAIDRISGKRHFQIPVFRPGAMAFAYFQKKRAEWFNIYPNITPGWVRTFFADWPCSCEKARRELGYRPTPLAEGIRTTYEWLQRVRREPS